MNHAMMHLVCIILAVCISAASSYLMITHENDNIMNRLSMLMYENMMLSSKVSALESKISELNEQHKNISNGIYGTNSFDIDGKGSKGEEAGGIEINVNTNSNHSEYSITSNNSSGKFILTYTNGISNREIRDMLTNEINLLNKRVILPYDVKVIIEYDSSKCKSIAAYYSSSSKSITLCYSTLEYFVDYAKKVSDDGYERLDIVNSNVRFIIYHEVAHALIDIYKLPILGREESAADTFAILMMLNNSSNANNSNNYIEHVIKFYDTVREDKYVSADSKVGYWDEHMFFAQTYYDMICLAYGKDSNTYSMYKQSLHDRAGRCAYEYNKQVDAFNELFKSYIINE
jgi:hypothetical protein